MIGYRFHTWTASSTYGSYVILHVANVYGKVGGRKASKYGIWKRQNTSALARLI